MLQHLANGLCIGSIIAIVGLGFGLIYNTARVFHIAHGGIYVLSGYAVWIGITAWYLPLSLGILFALTIAAISGVAVYWFVYLPLSRRSAPATVLLISSIGVQIVLENTIALIFGNQSRLLSSSLAQAQSFGPVSLTHVQLAQFIVGSLVTLAFWLFLKYTKVGQIFRAVSDDVTLSRVLGIRTTQVHLLVFAIGSGLAGLGSVLVSLDVGTDPYVGFPAVLTAAVACIIGGVRNFLAPAVGGFLLGLMQSLVVWQTSAQWKDSVTFGLLIIFLLVRRQGLFGVYRRAEES